MELLSVRFASFGKVNNIPALLVDGLDKLGCDNFCWVVQHRKGHIKAARLGGAASTVSATLRAGFAGLWVVESLRQHSSPNFPMSIANNRQKRRLRRKILNGQKKAGI